MHSVGDDSDFFVERNICVWVTPYGEVGEADDEGLEK